MKILGWLLTGAAGVGVFVIAKKVFAKPAPFVLSTDIRQSLPASPPAASQPAAPSAASPPARTAPIAAPPVPSPVTVTPIPLTVPAAPPAPPVPLATTIAQIRFVSAQTGLKVRTGPGTNFPEVRPGTTAQFTERVTLLGESPAPTPNASLGWGNIRTLSGLTGWVSREFLTTTEPGSFQTKIVTQADQPIMTATEEGGGVLRAVEKNIPSIQMVLNAVMGTSLPITGQMDAATIRVVKAFQTASGLNPDGNPGPLTVAALNKKFGV